MAMGTVFGVIGTVAGAAALIWTWQVNEELKAVSDEDLAGRVAALEDHAGVPEAVAAALAARIEADAALADRLRGPAGPPGEADVDAVAARLAAAHAGALAGPPGPTGADAVAPSAADIAAELLATAGDALTGPPGEPGPAGPPGPSMALPPGAVIAWQSDGCPEGWTPVAAAAGRFILGAGAGAGGTTYGVGATGGGSSHNHGVTVNLMPAGTAAEDPAGALSVAAAGPASGVAEHSLAMPPYLALSICTPSAP